MKKKLSIIIPIYNVEKYLQKCINSIIIQKNKNFELLLIDDGSTDNSLSICKEFEKDNSDIKVFHKNNGGLSDARNFGITKATGEYLWFIDSDDYIEKNCINKIIKIIEKHNPDVIVCQSKTIDDDKVLKDECAYTIKKGLYSSHDYMNTMKKNPKSIIFCAQYHICKKELITKNNILFYKNIIHEDELWTPQILMSAKNIYYSQFNIYYHYMRKSSIMHSSKLEKSGHSDLIVAKELNKIIKNSNRSDLQYIKDRNVNTFLQAVWKKSDFFEKFEKNDRVFPIKNSYYFKTKLKSLLFLASPKLYHKVHSLLYNTK